MGSVGIRVLVGELLVGFIPEEKMDGAWPGLEKDELHWRPDGREHYVHLKKGNIVYIHPSEMGTYTLSAQSSLPTWWVRSCWILRNSPNLLKHTADGRQTTQTVRVWGIWGSSYHRSLKIFRA